MTESIATSNPLEKPWCHWMDDDGCLVVRERDEPPRYLRIAPWRIGLHISYHSGWLDSGIAEQIGWHSFHQNSALALLSADREKSTHPLVDCLLTGIPEAIEKTVRPYKDGQLRMLWLSANLNSARELIQNNPLLVYLVIKKVWENDSNLREVVDTLTCTQVEILSLITGMPMAKRHVRFLRKITFIEINDDAIHWVLYALKSDERVNMFSHWDSIPIELLIECLRFPKKEFVACVHWSLAHPDSGHSPLGLRRLVMDLYGLCEQVGLGDNGKSQIRRIDNPIEAEALHDRWVEQVADEQAAKNYAKLPPYSQFPLPDSKGIKAIRTPLELFLEGKEMHHCVSIRDSAIRDGCSFIYRVLAPQRGTLEIAKTEHGFEIMEFRLSCNSSPSTNAWQVVEKWLNENQPEPEIKL